MDKSCGYGRRLYFSTYYRNYSKIPSVASPAVGAIVCFAAFMTFLLVLSAPAAYAKQARMTLLAVTEGDGKIKGSVAELTAEVLPGKGRVFMETFPVAKFDTQISTRIAKEISCSYIEADCSTYDFFYTINAKSPIIGGPSAGAAVAVITVATMLGMPIDERTAITGTINSGGIIGSVGGIREKIEAAASAGIKKVLVPAGETKIKFGNITVDLIIYGKELGVEVVEVQDLDQAIYEFTGKHVGKEPGKLEIDDSYSNIMRYLAVQLCNRSLILEREATGYIQAEAGKINRGAETVSEKENTEDIRQIIEYARNLSQKGIDTFDTGKYYSAASFCYGSNVRYRSAIYRTTIKNKSHENAKAIEIKKEIDFFEQDIDSRKKDTILDLQTYLIVKERVLEAKDHLNASFTASSLANVSGNLSLYELALATERLESAKSWLVFFGKGDVELKLDKNSLKSGCARKISEAEERLEYVNNFIPFGLEDARLDIKRAYDDLEQEKYELCIFKASKAKARADVVLSVLGSSEELVESILDKKLELAKNAIARQTEAGVFPILAYSYYEYAQNFAEDEKYSALLYTEYALELSNLKDYLAMPKKPYSIFAKFEFNLVFAFIGGVATALLVIQVFKDISKKDNKEEL